MSAPLPRKRLLQSTTRLTADFRFTTQLQEEIRDGPSLSAILDMMEGEAIATCGRCQCVFVRFL